MSDNSKNLSSTKDLKRVLGFWDLMAVGIGSIIGSGIMSLTGWGIDETAEAFASRSSSAVSLPSWPVPRRSS